MSQRPPHNSLSRYTSILVEILVVTLSIAPILVLIYFYPVLPERIPVFLNLHGEVEKWAAKSVASVFRVPAMAIDLQLICLLMKYAVVRSQLAASDNKAQAFWQYQDRMTSLTSGLWDLLRSFVAIKMCAESLSILFLSDNHIHSLKIVVWAIPWMAAILSVLGAVVYGFRLLGAKRNMKKSTGHARFEKKVDNAHLLLGLIYYNPNDPAPLAGKYLFNFANKYVYALFAGLLTYPLLVFWPV
jgi:uncharacterized membrane protein